MTLVVPMYKEFYVSDKKLFNTFVKSHLQYGSENFLSNLVRVVSDYDTPDVAFYSNRRFGADTEPTSICV